MDSFPEAIWLLMFAIYGWIVPRPEVVPGLKVFFGLDGLRP